MQSFEAGPWEAKGTFTSDTAETMAGKLCVMSATGTVIAVTWSEDVRCMAAAAPTMLEQLELAADLIEEALSVHIYGDDDEIPEPGDDCQCNYVNALASIRATIAAAKGGAA